jgi:hypothetical protein
MHAGLVPLVTRQASVDLDGFGWEIGEASVAAVREAVVAAAGRPSAELRERTRAAWSHARRCHTRASFARDHRRAIESILERRGVPA